MSSPEPRGSDERRRRGAVRLAVALLLAVFALLCAHGLRWDTPTVDEFAHLPAGYYYLRTGNFALYNQNPPLVRLLSALPLLALDPPPAVDTGARLRNTGWYPWIFGTDFMERNRGRYELIFLLGRLPIVALGLLAGWLVFVWARDLYGDEAGLVALVCFVFCPNIVAHAHLATVDAGHAALVLLALYLFQRYLRRPGAAALLGCGAALGLAQLTKYTAVVLYPIFVLLSLLRLLGLLKTAALARGESLAPAGWRGGEESAGGNDEGSLAASPRPTRREGDRRSGRVGRIGRIGRIGRSLAALAAIFVVSLVVLDAGYLFHGVGRPAGAFHFQSRLLHGVAATLPAWLPLPLPATYLAGFDVVQFINDAGEFPSYLLGRWSRHGSLAYYPLVLLVKTPLPLLAAWLGAVLISLPGWRRQPASMSHPGSRHWQQKWRLDGREAYVWLPAAMLLAVFILLSKVDYGIRYLLPVLPLAMIFAGRLVPWARRQGRLVRAAAVALLLCYPFSVLLATPDTISYFNLLAGGRGDRILLDANLDWGQGLKRLRAYLQRAGIERIPLAYFGHVDPAIYGIRWQFPDPRHPGPVAISANFLHGYPYATYAAGRIAPIPADAFTWIGRFPRTADLGGGIYIYDLR